MLFKSFSAMTDCELLLACVALSEVGESRLAGEAEAERERRLLESNPYEVRGDKDRASFPR